MNMLMLMLMMMMTIIKVGKEEIEAKELHRVIGAGFGRTGTTSLMNGLEQIYGKGKCHHMYKVLESPVRTYKWYNLGIKSSKKEPIMNELKYILEEFPCAVDFPACTFFEDQLKLWPDAKVILTVRSSPAAWQKSASETILLPLMKSIPLGLSLYKNFNPLGMIFDKIMVSSMLVHFRDVNDEQKLREDYEAWIKHVRSIVPPSQLLEIQIGENSWAPICKFLEIENCPSGSFPKDNSKAEFKVIETINIVGYVTVVVYMILFLLLLRYLTKSTPKQKKENSKSD